MEQLLLTALVVLVLFAFLGIVLCIHVLNKWCDNVEADWRQRFGTDGLPQLPKEPED